MSDHSHEPTPPAAETFDPKHAGGLPNLLLTVGIVGAVGSLVGLIWWRQQFAFSWLFAAFYFFTLCMGAFFWTCLHHASDSEWSVVVRRQLENLAKLLPASLLLFIPLIFCTSHLWRWWDTAVGADPLLDEKRGYLNHTFFYIRALFYLFMLWWFSYTLWRRSTNQDADGAARHTLVMRKFGVAGIPLMGICLTFSAIDWLMALDHHWFSTMWGVYVFAGAAGSSMSLLILIVTALKHRGYLKVVNDEHYHIMGKYLLAFVIFWAYIGFAQYMLIWYANIPEETSYFLLRNTESWWYLSQGLVVFRFFLPFPVLLFQATKKTKLINYTAGWILLMQLVDIYVIVLPVLHRTGFSPSFFDAFAVACVGGLLGWLFFKNLGSSYLFPTRDPRLLGSLKLTN